MSVTPSGNWTLGGTAIAVDRDSGDTEAKYSEIEILGANSTVIQTAGSKSERRTISGLVSGGSIATLKGYKNTTKALVSDQGAQGNYYVGRVREERVQDVSTGTQTSRLTFDLIKQ